MGWSNGGAYRSATAMGELGEHMERVLAAEQWQSVQPLFHLANCAGGPFEISVRDAAAMADAFHAASKSWRVPRFWRKSAGELAVVAERHVSTGQPWRWS